PDVPVPKAPFAHKNVIHARIEHVGGTCSDSWQCKDCKKKFVPVIEQPQRSEPPAWYTGGKPREQPPATGDRLPCGCTIIKDDAMKSSVFWNPFNKVVQCHKCGKLYEPVI